MVGKVECRQTELNRLTLRDLEVLVNTQIGIKERRSRDIGPNKRPVDAADCGLREAIGVEALTGSQALPGIADQVRLKGYAIGPQNRLITLSRKAGIKALAGQRLNRRTGLVLKYARKLPSIHHPTYKMILMDGARQVDHIGGVEYVEAVEGKGAIVVFEVKGVE